MLVVVVLRKATYLSKEEFGTMENPHSIFDAHINHTMTILWTYRALYTIRYEAWAIQACSLVAFSIIFNLNQNTILHETFEKLCIILFEISQVYPIASDVLFGIKLMVDNHRLDVSRTARKYLSKAERPRHNKLTEDWRVSIVLAKDNGMRGGVVELSLGDIIDGRDGLKLAIR